MWTLVKNNKMTVLICPMVRGYPNIDPFTGYGTVWEEPKYNLFGLDTNNKSFHCDRCSKGVPCMITTEIQDPPQYCIGSKMMDKVIWEPGLGVNGKNTID